GFTLHLVPMSLWYAGIILALLLHWRGDEQARRLSARLMQQMPIIIAPGVTLGSERTSGSAGQLGRKRRH
ncbi:MAG TPA: hypothetical protein VNM72_15060, partial [Blastocatellia bacterium]|nr:hypothetical protein [Blastocatellia bacterium]